MIWPASCGISATGLRMRSRMSVLTRFISSCNRVFSRSSEALGGDFSSRACTATATRRLFPCLTEPHVQASIEPSLEGSSPSAWTIADIGLRERVSREHAGVAPHQRHRPPVLAAGDARLGGHRGGDPGYAYEHSR